MDEQERHAKGMEVRRAVLGSAHVDRAEANKTELTSEFQNLISRYAWGEIWTRPGLPRRFRSAIKPQPASNPMSMSVPRPMAPARIQPNRFRRCRNDRERWSAIAPVASFARPPL